MKKKIAIILHQVVDEFSALDEIDVLEEVELVRNELIFLNFDCVILPFTSNFVTVLKKIEALKPIFVVNLVESFMNKNKLAFIVPEILKNLGIAFTGNSSDSIYLTTNKLLTKEILKLHEILTPSSLTKENFSKFKSSKEYIIKPIDEDASIGIGPDSIKSFKKIDSLKDFLDCRRDKYGFSFFAEEFINGREFNISVLSIDNKPKVLKPAEIEFLGFEDENRHKIVDYSAKWVEDSFQFMNTKRTFEFKKGDEELIKVLERISLKCWDIFRLNGYARIDFRVDKDLKPFVIEVNANPCLSADSGFIAACNNEGISTTKAIDCIINSLL